MKKIPTDAFDFYFSLGPGRSYQSVADRYGVSKRAVTSLAKREDWQRRLLAIEAKARDSSDKDKEQVLEAAYERHMKALRLVFGKGIEALNRMVIDSPADAMRAIRMAIQEERVALGEPTERTAVSIEDTIKREYERWMVVDEDGGGSSGRDSTVAE
jgi:hypothetical protein